MCIYDEALGTKHDGNHDGGNLITFDSYSIFSVKRNYNRDNRKDKGEIIK